MAQVTLIEAQPWDAATGAIVPVRLAGGGRRHYRHKGQADWIAGVVNPPLASVAIGFDGNFTGGGIAEVGAVGFMPARAGARARIGSLVWTDAPIVVSTADDVVASPAWRVELAGKVAGYTVQQGLYTFTVANLAGKLADALVTGTFAGTGGIEGDATAAGRVKRRLWGRCWNVEGRLLDAASNVYEFGDPAHPLMSFDAVKDMGRPGDLTIVGWAGSIAATLTALKAATAPAGGAAVAPAIACVKWNTKPIVLTADLRGEIGSGYVESVAGIAAAVSAAAGGPLVDALVAAIAVRPDPAGILVDAGETGVAVLDRLLLRASMAWSVTAAGTLSIEPLTFDNPVATLTATAAADREAVFAPVTAVSVGWRRNHRIHTTAEISAAVTAGDVAWPDIIDTDGTKPADNADVTGDNIAKDTKAVGGKPAADVLAAIDAGKARLDELENTTIPAVAAAVTAASDRITAARSVADAAKANADTALTRISTEVTRIDSRIDSVSAGGGYDDTALKAEVKRVDEAAIGRDAALGSRVDTVSAGITTADTNLRALIQTKEQAAVDRENAISQRVDELAAEGGGGGDGADTFARSEIQRVEQASVGRDGALGTRIDTIKSSVDTVDTRIAAKAEEVTKAFTTADQALGSRASVLEASSRADTTLMNANANFSDWPDSRGTVPNGWGLAAADIGAYANRVSGILGRYALETGWPGSSDPKNFFYAVSGISFGDFGGGVDAGMAGAPGWYVMEADITLVSGSLSGAGLYCAAFRADGVGLGIEAYSPFSLLSANGGAAPGAGVVGGRYRFHVLVDFTNPAVRVFRFHPMVAWTNFGAAGPKVIRWHKAGLRQATPQEIAAQRADSGVAAAEARITASEATLADLPNRYATAQRANSLEASVGNVSGRVGAVETVTSNGTFATASTVNTLRTEYNGTKQEVSDQRGVLNTVGGKVAAYVRIFADAGNGRAALSLWSDQYGGAWQLTGNGIISGDLTVDGTITARKFNGASMAREARSSWSGYINPANGQTISVPWSLTLPTVPPTGRFIYEYTVSLYTNAGQSVNGGYENGKPVTYHYVDDGGGLFLQAGDGQGNQYYPRPNASDRIIATTDFTPNFTAFVRRGSRNQRVDDGDNIQYYVAATYTLSAIDLKVTWVAI